MSDHAIEIRREWMTLLGCYDDEIEASIRKDPPVSIVDELWQLYSVEALETRDE